MYANYPSAKFKHLAPVLVDVPRRLSVLEATVAELSAVTANMTKMLQGVLDSGADLPSLLQATQVPMSVASPGLAPSSAASAASAVTASSSGPDHFGMPVAGPSRLPAGAVEARGMYRDLRYCIHSLLITV